MMGQPARFASDVGIGAAFACLAIIVAVVGIVPEAKAQAQRTERYLEDWSVLCLQNAEGVKTCNMIQARIRTEPRSNLFRWVIGRDREGRDINYLQAPLGVWLAGGIRLSVEGEEIDRVTFDVCDQTWCQASYPMTDELLGYFVADRDIEIQYQNARQQPISTRITANGFQEALQHYRTEVE
jgi:invasion protein IalB